MVDLVNLKLESLDVSEIKMAKHSRGAKEEGPESSVRSSQAQDARDGQVGNNVA